MYRYIFQKYGLMSFSFLQNRFVRHSLKDSFGSFGSFGLFVNAGKVPKTCKWGIFFSLVFCFFSFFPNSKQATNRSRVFLLFIDVVECSKARFSGVVIGNDCRKQPEIRRWRVRLLFRIDRWIGTDRGHRSNSISNVLFIR